MLDESRNVRHGFLDAADFEKIRAALHPAVYADAASFAYVTGWRFPSEVLPLTWNQGNLREGLIRIDPGVTKSGEGRQLPITATLRKILKRRQQHKREECALVFHVDGQAIHRRAFHTAWTAAREEAQLPKQIPHDMRRSAVRNLERAGIPRRVAMQMVGHRTESIYQRYHIVAESDIHEAGARLDAAATGKPVTTKLVQFRNQGRTGKQKNRRIAESLRKLVPEVGIEPTRGVTPTGF
jgi:integrase